ncbi:MAG: VCBS repeat-containing protein, partial [Myxococcota bacterium]|nr:VCBS repeat-containing protein [Myxococcota bacterium]
IHVAAEQIGSKLLRLVIDGEAALGNGMFWILPAEPVETAPYHYSFTVDGFDLTQAATEALRAEAVEDADEDEVIPEVNQFGPLLNGGDTFRLAVAAFTPDEDGNVSGYVNEDGLPVHMLPTDARLVSDWIELTMDMDPPEVEIVEPSSEFGTPTLTGVTNIAGTVTDDEEVARIEVEFQGSLKAEIIPEAGNFSVPFDVEVDLRYEESSDFANLDVKAYDACGHSASIVDENGEAGITTKVIAWPWIRSFDHRYLPEDPQIRDSEIADWDGDGYNEIFFATAKGVFMLPNGADGEDLDENGWDPDAGTFPEVIQLTTPPTSLLAISDLDADGDMDLLTVQDEAGAKVLALFRREVLDPETGESELVLTEMADIPVSGTSQVRALLVADFNNTVEEYRRDDVVIVTSGAGETLLLYKRYYDDEAPTNGGDTGEEGEEGEEDEPV